VYWIPFYEDVQIFLSTPVETLPDQKFPGATGQTNLKKSPPGCPHLPEIQNTKEGEKAHVNTKVISYTSLRDPAGSERIRKGRRLRRGKAGGGAVWRGGRRGPGGGRWRSRSRDEREGARNTFTNYLELAKHKDKRTYRQAYV
jgi:hypothetical protein